MRERWTYIIVVPVPFVVKPIAGIKYLDSSAKVVLPETLPSVRRQNMRDVHYDVIPRLAGAVAAAIVPGKSIRVHPSPLRSPQLHHDPGAEKRPVIPELRLIRPSPGIRALVDFQWVVQDADDGHLVDDAVLGRPAGAGLMEHGEAGEVAGRKVARVGVDAVFEVRAELDHAQGAGDAREGVSASHGAGLGVFLLTWLYEWGVSRLNLENSRLLGHGWRDRRTALTPRWM